ncbi:hypothetical protein SEA_PAULODIABOLI_76 [Microbacterium phage PauloDiaboli]|nr:hypothetical protein SEA_PAULODIABOLI_76 [Microbacterium phage PauloDiaboli]
MLKLYSDEQHAAAGVLHIPKSAREAPDAMYTGEDEFLDQLTLAMTTPISDTPLPKICYCPGDDPDHA